MTRVSIVEYTDPICPWAWSAEPHRLKLRWTYGDGLDWEARMVGLAEDPDVIAKRFTPEEMARNLAIIAERFGMPIYEGAPERMQASFPACRAVVATRLNQTESTYPLLRELRKRCFSGEFVDEGEVIGEAAGSVGVDPSSLASWTEDDATEVAFVADRDAARHPTEAALALKGKLAEWDGGWRYTCPSYVLSTGERELTAPGYQPVETYEVAIANLASDLPRRAPAESAEEALTWAADRGEGSLATVEVAALTGRSAAGGDRSETIEELKAAGAEEHRVGSESFWSLPEE